MKTAWKMLMVATLLCFLAATATAQNLSFPQSSPKSSITQQIGLTTVTIDYHRPGVKDREVWGSLVPYGMSPGAAFGSGNEYPWRAGANDNTTISFSHDVMVEGKQLSPGTYGLHMIPGEGEWVVIFSHDNLAWGSFFYDPANDAARVTVQPESVDHEEWLRYGFTDLSNNGATAYVEWEKRRIPFRIEVNTQDIVLDYLREQMTHLAAFNWQSQQQAANYCLQNNINHEEALTWIERSINNNRAVSNLGIKARLLDQMGRTADAETVMNEAFQFAQQTGAEADMNSVGYIYLFSDRVDKAIDVFKRNVKTFPDAWNVYDSLGEGYDKKGDKANAIKNYQIALEKAPAGQKSRIEGIITRLQQES